MSCTEIIAFGLDGKMAEEPLGTIQNSWRGAPAIWRYAEEKYLDPYFPNWISDQERLEGAEKFFLRHGYKPSRVSSFEEEGLQEIFDLAYDVSLPENDRIVIASTFDRALVRKDEIKRVIEAFRNFGAKTSLKEQADILEKALDAPEVDCVGWIQTSVCCDMWSGGWDDEADEEIPYDLNVNDGHFWLFDIVGC